MNWAHDIETKSQQKVEELLEIIAVKIIIIILDHKG